MSELFRRLRWFFHRAEFERDLEEEMRHHREMSGDRQFGNFTLIREESREMWAFAFLSQLSQDTRYAFRAMASRKLFTGIAVASLALGIGANTAIFSFMDAVMVRALPVRHPEELVNLNWRAKKDPPIVQSHWGSDYDEPGGGITSPNISYPAFELLRDKNQVLSSLFGYMGAGRMNLMLGGNAQLGDAEYVTGGYFDGLGVNPVAGRMIGAADDVPGAPCVAVLSYSLWQSRFAGDPAAIGKTIQINNVPFTLAGVTPPEFFGIEPNIKPDVFVPVSCIHLVDFRPDWETRIHEGTFYWIELTGRLRPGVTIVQAQAQLAGMFHGFVESTVTKDRERANLPTLWLQEGGSGVDSLRRDFSKPLWIMMSMVALILTIACANVANLLLARASARRREMAVRLSLGAGRFRIVRQLLTESILIALLGGVFGLAVAAAGIRALRYLVTNGRDSLSVPVGLDWPVLAFTLSVAIVTGILFGLVPAIQSTRVDVTPALKESRASAPSRHPGRFRIPFGLSHVLVVSQVAISLLLVAAAGLFVRTLANLHAVDIGFNRENILLFDLNAANAGYSDQARRTFYGAVHKRLISVPGVRGTTMSDLPLVGGWSTTHGINVPGIPKPPEGQRGPNSAFAVVGPSFFETMQIPILAGRPIDEHDNESAHPVAVVNEVFAKRYFHGENPVGRHFATQDKPPIDVEIVGLAKTVRYNSLKREIPAVTYLSYLQPTARHLQQMYFEVRTAGDPLALATTVRKIVQELAPRVPVGEITTQARRIDQTINQERMFAELCTCFGVLALVMACIGLYGVMAYAVARRTGEIGIRMALGAARRRIVWMVLREVLALSIVGLAIGFIAVLETTSLVKSFLFGMEPNDPLALGASVAILVVCAALAGYAPAWRASRIDPMAALRHE